MRAAGLPLLVAFAVVVTACRSRDTTAPADASPASAVGCHSDEACARGEYCAFTPGLCGRGAHAGQCRARPAGCHDPYAPVCGCDGTVYPSACAAHVAGVDLAAMGGCAPVPDWAPCGPQYCDARTSYCEIYLSDVFELPSDHFCRSLPESCRSAGGAVPTCACFPATTACLSFCGPLPTGGREAFHLTCQGRSPP